MASLSCATCFLVRWLAVDSVMVHHMFKHALQLWDCMILTNIILVPLKVCATKSSPLLPESRHWDWKWFLSASSKCKRSLAALSSTQQWYMEKPNGPHYFESESKCVPHWASCSCWTVTLLSMDIFSRHWRSWKPKLLAKVHLGVQGWRKVVVVGRSNINKYEQLIKVMGMSSSIQGLGTSGLLKNVKMLFGKAEVGLPGESFGQE